MNRSSLLFVVLTGLTLVACSPQPKETADLVWLNHFVAGQIRISPGTKIDAENVVFYEQGSDVVVPLDQLATGQVYDFAKSEAKDAVVIVITSPETTEPTRISVAKHSDLFKCPEWAVRFFGKRCETKSYEISYP